jgi:hypothetical protein
VCDFGLSRKLPSSGGPNGRAGGLVTRIDPKTADASGSRSGTTTSISGVSGTDSSNTETSISGVSSAWSSSLDSSSINSMTGGVGE